MNPVTLRACLYFAISFGTLAVNEFKSFADGTVEPSFWRLAWVFGSALVAGLVTLRAYFDGSAERERLKNEKNDTNAGAGTV